MALASVFEYLRLNFVHVFEICDKFCFDDLRQRARKLTLTLQVNQFNYVCYVYDVFALVFQI